MAIPRNTAYFHFLQPNYKLKDLVNPDKLAIAFRIQYCKQTTGFESCTEWPKYVDSELGLKEVAVFTYFPIFHLTRNTFLLAVSLHQIFKSISDMFVDREWFVFSIIYKINICFCQCCFCSRDLPSTELTFLFTSKSVAASLLPSSELLGNSSKPFVNREWFVFSIIYKINICFCQCRFCSQDLPSTELTFLFPSKSAARHPYYHNHHHWAALVNELFIEIDLYLV